MEVVIAVRRVARVASRPVIHWHIVQLSQLKFPDSPSRSAGRCETLRKSSRGSSYPQGDYLGFPWTNAVPRVTLCHSLGLVVASISIRT
jgi:hypothetical protein